MDYHSWTGSYIFIHNDYLLVNFLTKQPRENARIE